MSNKKEITHGGARQLAGREPVADPKQPVVIYVEQSIIDANNGIEECKSEMYFFLKERGQKSFKKKSFDLILPFDDPEFIDKWNRLTKMKKWRNKSDIALQTSLKMLSEHDLQTAIETIDKAISGEYQGIHPPKKKNKYDTTKNITTISNPSFWNEQSNA